MIRGKYKDQNAAAEAEAACRRAFAAVEAARPEVRWEAIGLADGVSFVVLVEFAGDNPAANPLYAVPEYREFAEKLKTWIAEPPAVETMTVVGSYKS